MNIPCGWYIIYAFLNHFYSSWVVFAYHELYKHIYQTMIFRHRNPTSYTQCAVWNKSRLSEMFSIKTKTIYTLIKCWVLDGKCVISIYVDKKGDESKSLIVTIIKEKGQAYLSSLNNEGRGTIYLSPSKPP